MGTMQDVKWPKDKLSAEFSLRYWEEEAKRNSIPGAPQYYSDLMIQRMIENCKRMLKED